MAKKVRADTDYHCEDCVHHYQEHEIGADGRFFLCKCPFFKWSKFLRRDCCKDFKLDGKIKSSESKK